MTLEENRKKLSEELTGQELDIDTFGEVMDDFIKRSHVMMLIEMPEGEDRAEISTNMPGGPAMDFYILMNGLISSVEEMVRNFGADAIDYPEMIRAVFQIAEDDVISEFIEKDGGEKNA